MIALDTHAVLWALGDIAKLSQPALRAIEETESRGGRCLASSLSFYEIARGIFRGRIKSAHPIDRLLSDRERRFIVRPLTTEIAILAAQLPAAFPADPFDRIIAATALAERVPLLTADQHILNSGALRTIW